MALFSSLYKNKNERMKKIPYRMKNICIKKILFKKNQNAQTLIFSLDILSIPKMLLFLPI